MVFTMRPHRATEAYRAALQGSFEPSSLLWRSWYGRHSDLLDAGIGLPKVRKFAADTTTVGSYSVAERLVRSERQHHIHNVVYESSSIEASMIKRSLRSKLVGKRGR